MTIDIRHLIMSALMLAAALPPCAAAVTVLPTGHLATARYGATTATMSDGRAMIAGGSGSSPTTASIEIYDPASGRFTGGAFLAMTEPRSQAFGVSLPTGRVLIAGGREDLGNPASLRSAELFDPATEQSISTGMLSVRRHDATATLLADGRVLIIGGFAGRRW